MRALWIILAVIFTASCKEPNKTFYLEYTGLEQSYTGGIEKFTELDTIECANEQIAINEAYKHYRISRAIDSLIKHKGNMQPQTVIMKYRVCKEDGLELHLSPSDSAINNLNNFIENNLSKRLFN